jgi:hypothetical protein
MVKEQIKKRHHYLPRFYLEGFTKLDSNRLWVYEKGIHEIRPSTPEAEGYRKFYHAFVTDEGNRDTNTIEDYFEKIETKNGIIFAKIHKREKLTEQDRKGLALFVSFMLTRVPWFRSEIEKMAADHINHVGLDAAISDFRISLGTIGTALGIKPNISEQELRELPSRRGSVFSLAQIFHVAIDFFPKLLKLKWLFLFSSRDYKYVTSDNPLYFYSASATGSLPRDDFHNNDIEITLPLSKEVALIANRLNIQDGYGKAQAQQIKTLNKRTVMSATSYVYSSINSDSFNNFVQKYKDMRPYMIMAYEGKA